MKNIKLEEKKEGGVLTLGDIIECDFRDQLAEFRRTMPAAAIGFNADIVEKAFRSLFDGIEKCEPVIDLFAIADTIISTLREKNIIVMETYRDKLILMLDVMMRFLAKQHGYGKMSVESYRAEIKKLVWPHVTWARGDAGAVESLTDAILGYYDTHDEISTADATSCIFETCPGILELEELNSLLNEVFDFLCENGQLSENR